MSSLKMKKTHMLGEANYYNSEYPKSQIIIGNTMRSGLDHINGWKTRFNGKYKKTAPFTILKNGTIHVHFNPKHHSDFMGMEDVDMHTIPILLENRGWLQKDSEDDLFIDWLGDIYNEGDEIAEHRWRSQTYWSPYTTEQVDSLVRLCEHLCNKFDIPLDALPHNTKVDDIDFFNGIVYKSNYSKYFFDVSPAFDTEDFNNRIKKLKNE